jgi:ATP-dependent exoDNAse (exonuclease V) beta subunit
MGSPADALRAAEAEEVVATVQRVIEEGWSVEDAREKQWRPARLGDITILVPARTSLPFLEDALERGGIPFRAESSSLVYATRAVRDLLMVLRAIDDPTNELHTVAALRTPLLGCGDDDLFRFKVERRGRWSYWAQQPESVPPDDPVAAGLAYLRARHDERRWRSPSELLERIARDRRSLELGFAEGRARDVWRRLRFVIDQARAWSEATGGSLRQYLSWVAQQTAEGARVAESILPETDDDAVRIMTIHAAKGLEFPVTIVSGLSTRPQRRPAPGQVVFPSDGGPAGYKFGKQVETDEYSAWKPIDEQMEFHERTRLLYVACTRARDHLVVSLHRTQRRSEVERFKLTNAELLVEAMGAGALDAVPDAASALAVPLDLGGAAGSVPPPEPPLPFAEWAAVRDAAVAASARPTVVAATALSDDGVPDAGLQKRPRDLDLPPWLKGRYGSAVGRAVHGVLQTVELGGPSDSALAAAVAAQCQAESIPDRDGTVDQLVRLALGSPAIRAAAESRHWREIYACTPVAAAGGRLLEGYIDLLYRADDGLVVVDYKTSASAAPAELDRRVASYRMQGGSYAVAVAAATGEPVVRVTFVFLTPEGAIERHLTGEDLVAATEGVLTMLAAGDEREVESWTD